MIRTLGKSRLGALGAVICLCALVATPSLSDPETRALVENMAEKMRNNDSYSFREDLANACKSKGDEALKEVLPFLKDRNERVRYAITDVLASVRTDNLIPLFVSLLSDENREIPDRAMQALAKYPRASLMKQQGSLIDSLVKFGREPHDTSCMALLLLGDLGAKSRIPDIRAVIADAEATIARASKIDRPYCEPHLRKRQELCKYALYKLDDKETVDEIDSYLAQTEDIQKRALSIRILGYVGRRDLIPRLIPMLHDTRNVEPVDEHFTPLDPNAPDTPVRYVRIRDLAAYSLAEIIGLRFRFMLPPTVETYTDDQIVQVVAAVRRATR